MFLHNWPKSAFVAGNPLLDFLNTVDSTGRSDEDNRLTSNDSLIAWAKAAGLLGQHEHQDNRDTAITTAAQRREATEIIEWRETIYRAVTAIIRNESPLPDDMAETQASIQTAISHAQLVRGETGAFLWMVPPTQSAVVTITQRLSLSLHDLLRSDQLTSIKQCEGCSWMFIDRSKNHQRRWCSMSTCGAKAKTARRTQST